MAKIKPVIKAIVKRDDGKYSEYIMWRDSETKQCCWRFPDDDKPLHISDTWEIHKGLKHESEKLSYVAISELHNIYFGINT